MALSNHLFCSGGLRFRRVATGVRCANVYAHPHRCVRSFRVVEIKDWKYTAVIVHGSHNSFTLSFFNDLTSETGDALYIAGEVGIGLLAAWGIVALVSWKIYSKSHQVSN